eukprot:m.267770 g.267770  ORF g.267770 m.267770 type:complete len:1019 (+) comp17643_c0_seq1:70-3126(+)
MSHYRRVVEIPVRDTPGETVEFDLDELPNPEDVVFALSSEQAKLEFWLQLADHYKSTSNMPAFKTVLEGAVEANIEAVEKADRAAHRANKLRILVSLASCHIEDAKHATTAEAKTQAKDKAQEYISMCDGVGLKDRTNMLNKAQLYLLNRKLKEAQPWLLAVLQEDPLNAAALIGKAQLEFHRGHYEAALSALRSVLQNQPNCPASVRVGVGLCFAQLKQFRKARDAFQRALTLDSNNVQAMVGLAVLDINKADAESIKEGVLLMRRAFEHDNQNPNVLNHLANHFFYKGVYDKAKQLAGYALKVATSREMKAESHFHLGRICHAEADREGALKHYYTATKLSKTFTLPHYGLGQIYILKKNYDKAIEQFKIVHAAHPDNYEATKVLASLYAQTKSQSQQKKAQELFTSITKQHPEDIEAWIELAVLKEQHEPQQALKLYQQALKYLGDLDEALIQPELLNNLACLHFVLEQFDEASAVYARAKQQSMDLLASSDLEEEDQAYYRSLLVSIRYNQARTLESQHQLEAAVAAYKALLEEYPKYLDCYLRLGCIERDRFHYRQANDYFKEALSYSAQDHRAWTLSANVHMVKRQWKQAQDIFQKLIEQQRSGRHKGQMDSYSMLSLANIYFASNRMDHAKDFYLRVLRYDDHNIYAANGLACTLVYDHLNHAREIFLQVREAVGTDSRAAQVWINLAHTYVEQGSYIEATKLYKAVLTKFKHGHDCQVMSFMARALYKGEDYGEAVRVCCKMVHVEPGTLQHRFNLAQCQQQYAKTILFNSTSSNDIAKSEALLDAASSTFQYLAEVKERNIKYEPARAEAGAQACRDLLQQLQERRKRVLQQEEEERQRLQELTQRQMAEDLEKQARLEEERLKTQEQEKLMKEKIAAFEASKASLATVAEKPQKQPRKSKKETADFLDDKGVSSDEDFNYNAVDNAEAADGPKTKRAKPSKRKAKRQAKARSTEDDGGDGATQKKKKTLARDDSSDDDDDENIIRRKQAQARKGTFKSNEMIESSDED